MPNRPGGRDDPLFSILGEPSRADDDGATDGGFVTPGLDGWDAGDASGPGIVPPTPAPPRVARQSSPSPPPASTAATPQPSPQQATPASPATPTPTPSWTLPTFSPQGTRAQPGPSGGSGGTTSQPAGSVSSRWQQKGAGSRAGNRSGGSATRTSPPPSTPATSPTNALRLGAGLLAGGLIVGLMAGNGLISGISAIRKSAMQADVAQARPARLPSSADGLTVAQSDAGSSAIYQTTSGARFAATLTSQSGPDLAQAFTAVDQDGETPLYCGRAETHSRAACVMMYANGALVVTAFGDSTVSQTRDVTSAIAKGR